MKKTVKKLIISSSLFVLCAVTFVACKKEANTFKEQAKPMGEVATLQTSFAKILATAMKSDENLRSFIKAESLKQFDNDHDILYQLIKDKPINGEETIHTKLLKFTSAQELEKIENELPLLTIFVPTLPNFNPEIWNPVNEIPVVAVANVDGRNTVSLYSSDKEIKLKPTEIPGFPVVVVKENERVRVKAGVNRLSSNSSLGFSEKSTTSFEFIDKVFDGSIKQEFISSGSLKSNKLSTINGSVSRAAPVSDAINSPSTIDQVNIDAYNSGNEWQRDYVYYGLTPSNTSGKFKNNYSEFIASFKFLNSNDLNSIADQDGDPKANNTYKTNPGIVGWQNLPRTAWTDGRFEIRITVLINAKNGLGNELTKTMNVNGSDLFELQYDKVIDNSTFGTIYGLKSITPKEYRPNIELVPWDLENYGTAWKFIFYEIDNAQEVTNSYENTTTFATNFEVSGGQFEKVKVGFKLGASATTTEKRVFSVKTTLTSDFLGEATLTFDQPIIINGPVPFGNLGNHYITREITTGNNISISVEPRRTF